jgi:ABC-type uncharacterized transport system substrate-binding protein
MKSMPKLFIFIMTGLLFAFQPLTSSWAQDIAILQFASGGVHETGVNGILDSLRQRGYVNGSNGVSIAIFNANGDFAALDPLSAEIINGNFDLVLTESTPALQSFAALNQDTKLPHVFCLVSSPSTSNVGVGEDPADHPPYMTGLGTLQPYVASFQLAKELYPGLSKVGVVWNPDEPNSVIGTNSVREYSQSVGIELLEETVSDSAAVPGAVSNLIANGAEAIWIGADNTVLFVEDDVIQLAKAANIPAFGVIPDQNNKGSLFELGPDYYTVGAKAGNIATDVLNGADIASIPVEEFVPEILYINKGIVNQLKDPWNIPQSVIDRATLIFNTSSTNDWMMYQ